MIKQVLESNEEVLGVEYPDTLSVVASYAGDI